MTHIAWVSRPLSARRRLVAGSPMPSAQGGFEKEYVDAWQGKLQKKNKKKIVTNFGEQGASTYGLLQCRVNWGKAGY